MGDQCDHEWALLCLRCTALMDAGAIAELIDAAENYMEVRGSTRGQPARERLRAAIDAAIVETAVNGTIEQGGGDERR